MEAGEKDLIYFSKLYELCLKPVMIVTGVAVLCTVATDGELTDCVSDGGISEGTA